MERREAGLKFRIVRGCGQEYADAPDALALLRARGERAKKRRCGCRAAEKGDEFPSIRIKLHLILQPEDAGVWQLLTLA